MARAVEDMPESQLLVDLRASPYCPGRLDCLAIAAAYEKHADVFRGPIAVVVDNMLQYGVTRVISAHVEPMRIRLQVFHHPDDGHDWLDAWIRYDREHPEQVAARRR